MFDAISLRFLVLNASIKSSPSQIQLGLNLVNWNDTGTVCAESCRPDLSDGLTSMMEHFIQRYKSDFDNFVFLIGF